MNSVLRKAVVKLTKKIIDKIEYQSLSNRRYVCWDASIPGFGLRVYPSGKKSFVLSFRFQRRKRLMTLGVYGAITLEQAKTLAREKLSALASGKDPLAERKKENAGAIVKDLCDRFLNEHSKIRKRTAIEDEKRVNRHLLPIWGQLKVKSISTADVIALHFRIGKTAIYEANKTLALISKMWNLARQWGMVDEASHNPAKGIQKFREKKRERWVTQTELPKLALAIEEETNPYIRSAIWLYLLTGLRKTELLALKWGDIDFTLGEITLKETKAGRIHHLPLSNQAITILRHIPRETGSVFIFPGKLIGGHLVNIDKPWRKIRTRAEIPDVRLHDLRRTVGSMLAQTGHSLSLIGRVLNQSNPSTTKIYTHFTDQNVRNALQKHASNLIKLTQKKVPNTNLVEKVSSE